MKPQKLWNQHHQRRWIHNLVSIPRASLKTNSLTLRKSLQNCHLFLKMKFCTEKLILTIREHVFEISKTDQKMPINWKNNHCESINHILKLNLNWKQAKVPDLIKMLEKEVSLQESLTPSLTRGALYGTGNFELSTEAACLRVPQSVWHQKKDCEKQMLYRKFLSFGTRKPVPTTLTSMDGNFVIMRTKTVARKPGKSKKGVRVDKTVTVSKRRKMVDT